MKIFEYMQAAVEAAQTSEHPSSKVGACLVGDGWEISSPNFWPAPIKEKIGTDVKIGNSSGTIHAETACIVQAPGATNGASMFSTDPSCPNCMKNMAVAGIKHLYIDHKGFEKYFAQTRMEDFENLTLEICRNQGIAATKVFRKERRTEEILPPSTPKTPENQYRSPHFASCKTTDGEDYKIFKISLTGAESEGPEESKYNPLIQPINGLLMNAAQQGLQINPTSITSSRIPTSRELVNLIGAGYSHLTILDQTDARDEHGLKALDLLTKSRILSLQP